MVLRIRAATEDDKNAVWAILRPAVEAGDSLCAEPDGGREAALAYFWPAHAKVWIAEWDGEALGCYYLRPNQTGNGAHVCNAGYCTTPAARGRGVARKMLAHSLQTARTDGYRAMQYNFVVETNRRAIDIWSRAGFDTVGRLPGAFRHPERGYVDALVMYKSFV